MNDFVEAARLDELPPGTGTCVFVEGKDVALFNVDGTIYAMEDSCLHQGGSLGMSELEGKVVKCRSHGWRYDVTTGCMVGVTDYGVGTYPAKIEDGKIFVDITRKTTAL